MEPWAEKPCGRMGRAGRELRESVPGSEDTITDLVSAAATEECSEAFVILFFWFWFRFWFFGVFRGEESV